MVVVDFQKAALLVLHYHKILPNCRKLSVREGRCGQQHHLLSRNIHKANQDQTVLNNVTKPYILDIKA